MAETTDAAPAEAWTPPSTGTPCWVEIPAVDVAACKAFYAALFPSWEWKPATDKYTPDKIAMWSFAGKTGLSGGITQVPVGCKDAEQKPGTGFTVYLFVDSLTDTQKKVEELGGTTQGEIVPEGENGFYQYFKDVAGNRFGGYMLKK